MPVLLFQTARMFDGVFFFIKQNRERYLLGVFEVKTRVKTWPARGIWFSTIGALASPKMGDGTKKTRSIYNYLMIDNYTIKFSYRF